MGYIGMSGPKGYGFTAVLVIVPPFWSQIRYRFLHSSLQFGYFFKRTYSFSHPRSAFLYPVACQQQKPFINLCLRQLHTWSKSQVINRVSNVWPGKEEMVLGSGQHTLPNFSWSPGGGGGGLNDKSSISFHQLDKRIKTTKDKNCLRVKY